MTNLSKASIYRSFIAEVSETLPGVKGAKESAKMNSDAEAKCFAPRKIFLPFELKFEKTIDKLLMLVILAPYWKILLCSFGEKGVKLRTFP